MAWAIDWAVEINGRDLTSVWRSVLHRITVSEKTGAASDTCSLVVDDTDGQVRLPQGGETLVLTINGARIFEGVIEAPRSSGGRSEGRTLAINAKGFDTSGKAKQVQAFHLDDATLEQFLSQAAERAGYSLTIDGDLGAMTRDYWSADHESFLALGQRLANQYGGTFKLRGTRAVLARRGQGLAPGGVALPTVTARWGDNLKGWKDITPRDPRRRFKGGQARYFDRESAQVATVSRSFAEGMSEAENVLRTALGDQAEAEDTLEAREREGQREAGGGSVEFNALTVEARAEGTLILIGARDGIDGSYRIESVEHTADRGGGSLTTAGLKQPGG